MSSLSILALALIQALALLALAPLFSGISRVLRAKFTAAAALIFSGLPRYF